MTDKYVEAVDAMQVDTSKVDGKALAVRAQAHALRVTSQPEYEVAVEFLRAIKAVQDELAATFDPAIKAAHDAHKAMLAAKKRHAEPLEKADAHVRGLVGTYHQEQQRKAREEQQRLEAERAALARAAEEERRRREAANLYPSAEAPPPPPPPTDMPPPPPPPVEVPKAYGAQVRAKWVADVVDMTALVRAVAAGQAPYNLLAVDPTALRKFAEATHGTQALPGVVFRQEQVVAVRR